MLSRGLIRCRIIIGRGLLFEFTRCFLWSINWLKCCSCLNSRDRLIQQLLQRLGLLLVVNCIAGLQNENCREWNWTEMCKHFVTSSFFIAQSIPALHSRAWPLIWADQFRPQAASWYPVVDQSNQWYPNRTTQKNKIKINKNNTENTTSQFTIHRILRLRKKENPNESREWINEVTLYSNWRLASRWAEAASSSAFAPASFASFASCSASLSFSLAACRSFSRAATLLAIESRSFFASSNSLRTCLSYRLRRNEEKASTPKWGYHKNPSLLTNSQSIPVLPRALVLPLRFVELRAIHSWDGAPRWPSRRVRQGGDQSNQWITEKKSHTSNTETQHLSSLFIEKSYYEKK